MTWETRTYQQEAVAACPEIGEDVYDAVDLDNCVARRKSLGGTSVENVEAQIGYVRGKLGE